MIHDQSNFLQPLSQHEDTVSINHPNKKTKLPSKKRWIQWCGSQRGRISDPVWWCDVTPLPLEKSVGGKNILEALTREHQNHRERQLKQRWFDLGPRVSDTAGLALSTLASYLRTHVHRHRLKPPHPNTVSVAPSKKQRKSDTGCYKSSWSSCCPPLPNRCFWRLLTACSRLRSITLPDSFQNTLRPNSSHCSISLQADSSP